jgi:AcrR family transcriptional regulator
VKETEKKILQAATKLFSENGYSGTSTKKIAEQAGINEVTIFRHFKSKSNLLQSVIRHFSFEGNIIEKISNDITGNLVDDLYIFAEDYYMFLVNNIKMYKIQIKEISEEAEKFTNSIDYVKYMTEYLDKAAERGEFSGDSATVSRGIVAMIMGVFTLEVYAPTIYEDQNVRLIIKLFVDDIVKEHCVDCKQKK